LGQSIDIDELVRVWVGVANWRIWLALRRNL